MRVGVGIAVGDPGAISIVDSYATGVSPDPSPEPSVGVGKHTRGRGISD